MTKGLRNRGGAHPNKKNNTSQNAPGPSPNTDHIMPPITVDTAMHNDDDSSTSAVMSPRVHDVSEHAAKLKTVLKMTDALHHMVARQTSDMFEASRVASGLDKFDSIKEEYDSLKAARDDRFTALKREIKITKAKLEKHVKEKIQRLISEYVAREVKERVPQKLRQEQASLSKLQEENDGRLLISKQFITNVIARNHNAILRSNFTLEKVHDVPSSIIRSPSRKFPKTFGELLLLGPAEIKVLLKDKDLQESKKSGEEGKLENLNNLMGHLGIGYRLNPANPLPILSSVWDK